MHYYEVKCDIPIDKVKQTVYKSKGRTKERQFSDVPGSVTFCIKAQNRQVVKNGINELLQESAQDKDTFIKEKCHFHERLEMQPWFNVNYSYTFDESCLHISNLNCRELSVSETLENFSIVTVLEDMQRALYK